MFAVRCATSSLWMAFAVSLASSFMPRSAEVPRAIILDSQPAMPVDVAPPASCPVTQPPAEPFVPPAPYPTQIPKGTFWIGSEKLWMMRPINAV